MNIIETKLENLLKTVNNKCDNWIYLVNTLKNIGYCNKLNFAQEVLFTKIIDKLIVINKLTDWEVRNILFILLRSGVNIFNFEKELSITKFD